jgi:hypothetical protein
LSSGPGDGTLQRHGWDIAAAVSLLIAAYFPAGAPNHHAYGRFAYRLYEEGAYFERLRIVVCAAACFRWFPVAALGAVIGWLFNPSYP